ncbi:hypothetical protein B5M47_03585 [candidate division CPR3 bacterium 4484_211]|uniref:Uncharacterized protein n=1 Tax=candidate division CPR3 bacterium 4484_211 TaxID=1968527 RepID=A0A1W9NX75_UNCC3|nr:MAG: hypothetical protein B5M47_03585 [candidate division CPR3 bacterium 4484_211]
MKKLLLTVFLASNLFLWVKASVVVGETMPEFYSRPQVEQEAIRKAAKEAGMDLEEFLGLINPQVASRPFDVGYFLMAAAALISVGSLVLAGVLWRKQRVLEVKVDWSINQRDGLRKEHLKKLEKLVQKFHSQYGIYPSEAEFEAIRSKECPMVLDPLEGQKRPEGGRYSYYYTQVDPETNERNSQYYRLWCFLEDQGDQEAKDAKYILTPRQF